MENGDFVNKLQWESEALATIFPSCYSGSYSFFATVYLPLHFTIHWKHNFNLHFTLVIST